MARPVKEGLEYFPLDVDIDQDDKLVVVIGKFGVQGFGIVIRLMMEIYKNGYYYDWTEREQYAFSNRINGDINLISSIVSECIKWGFFHQKLYEEFSILTSTGFQKRFLLATNRRVKSQIKPEFNLVPEVVNADKNPVSANINQVSDDNMHTENTQSKVNKSKKKKKEDINPSSRQQKTYAEDSSPYKMALYLHKKIMEHAEDSGVSHLVKKTNLQRWADDCRKLLEIDKVEKEVIRNVIDWVTSHIFWKTNILSASKLREKFKELAIKMTQEKKGASQTKQIGNGSRGRDQGRHREKPQGVTPNSNGSSQRLSEEELENMRLRAAKLDEKLNKPNPLLIADIG